MISVFGMAGALQAIAHNGWNASLTYGQDIVGKMGLVVLLERQRVPEMNRMLVLALGVVFLAGDLKAQLELTDRA